MKARARRGQIGGEIGEHVQWLDLAALLVAVPVFTALAGWLVTPTKLPMVRRAE
jgi:hypothetical protein